MPAVFKSRQENFTDDDTFSTTSSTIIDDNNYQAESSVPNIDNYDLVRVFYHEHY